MIIKILKKIVKVRDYSAYHSRHKTSALKILKNIESDNGKTSAELIKRCDEYAIEVLGWKGYSPWLYVYSAMSGEFKEGWIPDNYYGKIVIPSIKGDYGRIADLKSISPRILNTDLLPDLAYYVNGLWVSKENEIIPEKSIKEYLFNKSNKVVFKLDNSEQGKGVFVLDQFTFDLNQVKHLGNGVFQDFINQHVFFDEFITRSVATIRLTTVIDNTGKSSARACYLRFGRKSDSHIQSTSNIRIPIDIETGEFSETGYSSDWRKIDRHPDSNTKFKNKIIPLFQNIKFEALKLQSEMPYAKCIGWDLILDKENKIKLMEWNGVHNGIKFHESSQGPCFADLGWENIYRKH